MNLLTENFYTRELRRAEVQWPGLIRTSPAVRGPRPESTGAAVVTIGSGCSFAVAKVAELAFAAAGAKVSRTCTPFEVVTSGMRPDIACIVSAKGNHPDTLDCFDLLRRRGVRVNVLTLNPNSDLALRAYDAGVQLIHPETNCPSSDDGFIPVLPTLALAMLVPFIFGPLNKAPYRVDDLFALASEHDNKDCATNQLTSRDHITILYTKWAEAGARDMETRMAESGLIPPTVCDPWNFGHGRYMPVARGVSKVITMTDLDDCGSLEAILRLMPSDSLLGSIVAPFGGFWGDLYCIMRSMLLMRRVASLHGIDPAVPTVPVWGNAVYNRGAEL